MKKIKTITISGQLGSGKSTITKLLSQKLGWQTYSTGQAQRMIAEKRGISPLELNKIALNDKTIDAEIDAVFQNPPWGDNPCIVDSRLAFFFIPDSFKVCLTVNSKIAAERVFNAQREKEQYSSVSATETALALRRQYEEQHFRSNYHININDPQNFDLIIDTSNLTPDEVSQQIIQQIQSR